MMRRIVLFACALIVASTFLMASGAQYLTEIERSTKVQLEWEEASLVHDAGEVEMEGEPGLDLYFMFHNSYDLSVEISVVITDTDVPGAGILAPTGPVPPGGSAEISLMHELLAPGEYHVSYIFFISTFWWEQSLFGRGTIIVIEGEEP